jgi:hypothetical protein
LPIKRQYSKQTEYVEKLENELNAVKFEQHEILVKFQELDDDIKARTEHLAIKRAELAELANKAAQEDALVPQAHSDAAKVKLGNKHTQLFTLFQSFLSKSNVLELLKQEGATEAHINNMESMWTDIPTLVKESAAVPRPPVEVAPPASGSSSADGIIAAATSAGPEADANLPPTSTMAVDEETLEKNWEVYLLNNPNLLEGGEERVQHAKQAFKGIAKKARTVAPY